MPRIDDLKVLKAEGKSARRVYGRRPEKYSLAEICEAGYTAGEAKRITGVRPSSLRHAGYTAAQMIEAEFGAADLHQAGFRAATLIEAGLNPADLYRAGYSASSLRRGNVSATTLREAGARAISLLRGGFDIGPMREAGYPASELARYGIPTRELAEAGYAAADLEPFCDLEELWMLGFEVAELKAANFTPDELQHYFGLDELLGAGFTHRELQAVGFDAADFQVAGSEVPPLKGIFSIEEMRDGGFGSAELTVTGGWDSATERAAVDEAYSAENDILRDAQAGQVDLDRIRRVKEEFLEKSSNLYRFTLEKRQFRDDLISTDLGGRLFRGFFTRRKTLANLRAEVQNIIEFDKLHFPKSDVGMQRRISHLEQMVVKIDEHVAEKARLKDELATVKERLDELIKLRIATLDKQIKGTWRHDGLEKRIAPSLANLESAYKQIDRAMRESNYDMAVAGFPLKPDTGDQARRDLLEQRRQLMGKPLDLESIKEISDPYLERAVIDGDTLTNLEKLMHLDRKVELLTWSVKELKAEKEGLKQLKELRSQTASLWSFVNKIEKCYPSFKSLADSVTKVTRSSKLLLGKKGQKSKKHWTKQKRLTGSRDIALEVGLNFGPDLLGASITIGLSVVISGTLTVEDDRRFRAGVDIQIVPNFKAKVGRGDANLMELSAKLGFTVKNAKYAFVDEKHFAYYMAFRIANIYILRRKLTAYGSRSLNQYFGLYDDEVKEVLEKMFEGNEARLAEMEDYLSNRPVVKAVVPKLNCPDIDFGFSSTVIPLEAGASANPYKRVVFRKSKLEIPKTNGAAAPAAAPARAIDVPELWEYEAAADGHCFFYSALFLLEWGDELWIDAEYEKRGFRALREEAVTQWRRLFLHRDEAGYEAFKGHLDDEWEDEDVRETFLEGMEDGSTYAEASMIYALADLYDAKIKVYTETGEVHEYTGRHFRAESDPVLHFGHRFERGGHYWPLLPGNGATEAPDPTSRGLELLHKDGITLPVLDPENANQVKFEGTPFRHAGAPIAQAQIQPAPAALPGPVTHSYQAEQLEARQRARLRAPKLITLERTGHSSGFSVNAELDTYIKLGIDAGYIHIDKNANPDNDGHYLNLKLKGGLLARGFGLTFNDGSVDLPPGSGAAQTSEDFAKYGSPPISQAQIQAWLKEWFDTEWDSATEAPIDSFGVDYNRSTRYLEFNFVGGGEMGWLKYYLQYMRWVYASSKSASVDIPVYVGIGVNIGLSGGKSVAISETIGTNTLTYLETIFNGLKQRPDGKAQWREYLEKQEDELAKLFRRIGKHDDCEAHKNALEMQDYAGQTTRWTEEHPVFGNLDEWLAEFPGTTKGSQLTDVCAQKATALYIPRRNQVLDVEDSTRADLKAICGTMTDIFWRATQVKAKENMLLNPWRGRVIHFAPPQGRIVFHLKLHGPTRCFYVSEPPYLDNSLAKKFWNKKRLFQYDPHQVLDESTGELVPSEYYLTSADVLKNPELADAQTVLAFYEHGFEVILRVELAGKTVNIPGRTPDGDSRLGNALLSLASDASSKRYKNNNLRNFKTFLNLHWGLVEGYRDWVAQLEEDKSAKDHDAWMKEARGIWEEFARGPGEDEQLLTSRFEEVLFLIEGPFVAIFDSIDDDNKTIKRYRKQQA